VRTGIFAYITQRDESHQVTTTTAAAVATATTKIIEVTFSVDTSSIHKYLIKMQHTDNSTHKVFTMERTPKRRMFAAKT
jgi:hypothetical protein